MTTSTTAPTGSGGTPRAAGTRGTAGAGGAGGLGGAARAVRPLLVLTFWLVVWQVAALAVAQRLLLPSPVDVATRLVELVGTPAFWATVAHSLLRIAAGFALGTVVGTLLAVAAATWRVVGALVEPVVGAVRAAPVVSFILLVLLWVDSSRLAVVVSALMVLPVTFAAVREGIAQRDPAMLEVATVFAVPLRRRVPAVDVPAVLPFFAAGCRVGVGLAWKSGIAAEVIGLPAGSIGEHLYDAKALLESTDVFVWTAVVVTLSLAAERAVAAGLRRVPSAAGDAGDAGGVRDVGDTGAAGGRGAGRRAERDGAGSAP
ncbi:ABC transporter permease [Cellulomonas biazotea]|uniref:ABC transporter permease n=2 Tax=Cellulomonas biazotea TaxID=1709 RepID=UPI0035EE3DCE